jgi:hypothetical protein
VTGVVGMARTWGVGAAAVRPARCRMPVEPGNVAGSALRSPALSDIGLVVPGHWNVQLPAGMAAVCAQYGGAGQVLVKTRPPSTPELGLHPVPYVLVRDLAGVSLGICRVECTLACLIRCL